MSLPNVPINVIKICPRKYPPTSMNSGMKISDKIEYVSTLTVHPHLSGLSWDHVLLGLFVFCYCCYLTIQTKGKIACLWHEGPAGFPSDPSLFGVVHSFFV